MATITIMFGDKTLMNHQMSKGDTVLIGRNRINDIVIDNLAVSSPATCQMLLRRRSMRRSNQMGVDTYMSISRVKTALL